MNYKPNQNPWVFSMEPAMNRLRSAAEPRFEQMIVDPDFVDHWKTRMLVDTLGDDELAPVYVIRLWAHCQHRRTWVFALPAAALKAICRFKGDASVFESAMITSGFVSRSDEDITVLGWEEYNASLIANWTNGKRGGRPKKSKEILPSPESETHGLPIGIPHETLIEPIRLDEIREESKTSVPSDATAPTGDLLGLVPTLSCPSEKLVSLYHACMPDNPRVKVLTDIRRKALAARWREASRMDCKPFGYQTTEQGLAAWKQFFEVCAESSFLTGRAPAQPGKPPFVADIDFLTSPRGFVKCLENKYHKEAA